VTRQGSTVHAGRSIAGGSDRSTHATTEGVVFMSRVVLRRAAAFLIAAAAIQHLHIGLVLEFEEYFVDHLLIGVLFLTGAAAGLVAAFLLLAGPYRIGWTLGALTAGGMLAGLVISRTIGLLGFDEQGWEHWNEPAVWLSVLIEGLFLAAFAMSLVGNDADTVDVLDVEVPTRAAVSV
jgi:hypothetical protein